MLPGFIIVRNYIQDRTMLTDERHLSADDHFSMDANAQVRRILKIDYLTMCWADDDDHEQRPPACSLVAYTWVTSHCVLSPL